MDIAELSTRVRLSTRMLRYVLDHRLLPGLKKDFAEGRGVPRGFDETESYAIALAGLLLKAGLKRHLVEICIEQMLTRTACGHPLNKCAFDQTEDSIAATLEIGDGAHWRLVGKDKYGYGLGSSDKSEMHWMPLKGDEKVALGYRPRVTLRVDLSALYNEVRK